MNKISVVLKTLIIGYVITVAALLILAFCLYKFRVSDSVITIGIYVTYGISTLFGGLILAKGMKNNRLMWGALYGVMYLIILSVISLIVSRGAAIDVSQLIKSAAVCIICGAVGGIVSP